MLNAVIPRSTSSTLECQDSVVWHIPLILHAAPLQVDASNENEQIDEKLQVFHDLLVDFLLRTHGPVSHARLLLRPVLLHAKGSSARVQKKQKYQAWGRLPLTLLLLLRIGPPAAVIL